VSHGLIDSPLALLGVVEPLEAGLPAATPPHNTTSSRVNGLVPGSRRDIFSGVWTYLKESFRRKRARRFTREYPSRVDTYQLADDGAVAFANWTNPLVSDIPLRQGAVDFFRQFIAPGDLALDIGAHIGDTTVPMALAAGPSGLVLGFDPNPFVYRILVQNAELNRDKTNIVPLPFAISETEDEFYFVSSEASFANGGVSLSPKSRHGKYVQDSKVQGVNLAKLLERDYAAWLPKLTFIKVDAEGYDAVILDSISDLIAKYKPVIVAEVFAKDDQDEKAVLYASITRHGYDLFAFEDFDVACQPVAIKSRDDVTSLTKTMNLYATPRAHDE
jgi:FkbM family methyltransferase